jgi:uncharacterized small protein (DUF1192 family)
MAAAAKQKQADCDKAVSSVRTDLAVQTTLAESWQREVLALQIKLEQLQDEHHAAVVSNADLKQCGAGTAGKEAAVKAEHQLRVAQLTDELERCKHELERVRVANAVAEAELKVALHHCPLCAPKRAIACGIQSLHGCGAALSALQQSRRHSARL